MSKRMDWEVCKDGEISFTTHDPDEIVRFCLNCVRKSCVNCIDKSSASGKRIRKIICKDADKLGEIL